MGEVIDLHDERLKRQKQAAWRKMKQRLIDDHDRLLWDPAEHFNCRCTVDLSKALADLEDE